MERPPHLQAAGKFRPINATDARLGEAALCKGPYPSCVPVGNVAIQQLTFTTESSPHACLKPPPTPR
ncbi:hypothetical protein ARTHRO9AX_180483 [Arthrobacter sp. 9AX]|nr:hypothetical protein ARTHRO9AX_180483 [Arthrobacter sp. 9AX]